MTPEREDEDRRSVLAELDSLSGPELVIFASCLNRNSPEFTVPSLDLVADAFIIRGFAESDFFQPFKLPRLDRTLVLKEFVWDQIQAKRADILAREAASQARRKDE
jgi:hypothetical protein